MTTSAAALEAAAAALLGVALAAAYAGPLRFELFDASVSVRTLSRPVAAALILLAVRFFRARDRSPASVANALARVTLGAVIAAGVTGWIRFLSTTCGGADSYGYVSAAERLLDGNLVHQEPLAPLLPYADGISAASPLGYVPSGRHPNATVPAYPLGLAAVMAAARAVTGPVGPFTVAPAAGLVLLAAAYATATSWYRDRKTALTACALLALNPLVFTYSIQPMSDVPAAAALLLAVALLSRARPFVAGAAAGLALLIRPALAPVAVALVLLLLAGDGVRRWNDARRYTLVVAAATVLQGWTQWYLYGHPLASGYGSVADLFTTGTVATNARSFGYWAFHALGPVFLGAVAIGLAVSDRRARLAVAIAVIAIAGPYLLYRPYDHWETLRFLLAAIAVATVVGAAGLLAVSRRVWGASGGAVVASVLTVAIGFTWMSWLATNGVFLMPEEEARHRLAGELVSQATTPQSVVLALQHSGSLRYYARRETLNWDRIPSGAFNATVKALQGHGFDVYVMIDSAAERTMFEARHGRVLDVAGWLPSGQRRNVQLFEAPRAGP